jgi:hypothetical protein
MAISTTVMYGMSPGPKHCYLLLSIRTSLSVSGMRVKEAVMIHGLIALHRWLPPESVLGEIPTPHVEKRSDVQGKSSRLDLHSQWSQVPVCLTSPRYKMTLSPSTGCAQYMFTPSGSQRLKCAGLQPLCCSLPCTHLPRGACHVHQGPT